MATTTTPAANVTVATKTVPWYKTGKGLSGVGLGIVFAFAIYISGKHIIHVALHYHQSPDVAYPLPAIIDLFALFCAIRRRSATSSIQRKLTAIGMWGMLTTSLWFNIESALIDNRGSAGWDLGKALFIGSLAAIVVAGAAEILTHVRKSGSSASKPKPATPKPATPAKAPSKAASKATPAKVTAPRQRKAPAVEASSEAPAIS